MYALGRGRGVLVCVGAGACEWASIRVACCMHVRAHLFVDLH